MSTTISNATTRIIHLSTDMKREANKDERYEDSTEYRFSNGKRFKRGKGRGVYA